MDVELENLQFLGVFGILKETMKLIYQWRRIFSHIALVFILPLSVLNLANMELAIFFFPKIKPSNSNSNSNSAISSETIIFYLTSYILSIISSLLSTAAVIYTVACIYTARDVSFKHVISVLPKVCKRLLLTFLCVFVALFAFNIVAFLVIFLIRFILIVLLINGPNDDGSNSFGFGFSFGVGGLTILFVLFFYVGTWYLTVIWRLSSVVSVLEEFCGFKAMAKSKALVKGKIWMVTKLLMLLSLMGVVQFVFYYLVVRSAPVGVLRGILGSIWVVLFSLFFLIQFVAETVLYFVCKSYHQESVHKSVLSDHLQAYLLADYVALKVEDDVGFEKLQVV